MSSSRSDSNDTRPVELMASSIDDSGILGNAKTTKTPGKLNFGLESYDTQTPYVAEVPNLYLSVTDNISVLKFPRLHEKLVADRVQDAYAKKQMSMELYSSTNKTDDNITRESLYRPRNFNFTPEQFRQSKQRKGNISNVLDKWFQTRPS